MLELRRSAGQASARRMWTVLALLSLVLIVGAGCTGAPAAGPPGTEAMPGAEPVPAGEGQPGSGVGTDEQQVAPGGDVGDGGEAQNQPQDGALIVRTGQLRLEVTDMAAAVSAGGELVRALGGYVSASEESNDTTEQTATVTYRIPADRWDEALAGLRALGSRVIGENTQAAEVTAEVVDLDARIANLRSAEAALQEIMNRAGTIDDVLEVQRELTRVRGEIEQLTARRDHLRDQAAYGTLAVTYGTPVVAVTEAQEGWDLGTEVDQAVAQLVRIGQAFASLGIWLVIVALPVIVPVALVLLVVVRVWRRLAPAPYTPPAGPIGPAV